jgi:hypothetical protein
MSSTTEVKPNADKPAHNLSQRGWGNVEAIMPKIKGAVSERTSKITNNIDLSTAENWLLRTELVEICKHAVAEKLESKVRRRDDICAPQLMIE